jgi:hypothetical protein
MNAFCFLLFVLFLLSFFCFSFVCGMELARAVSLAVRTQHALICAFRGSAVPLAFAKHCQWHSTASFKWKLNLNLNLLAIAIAGSEIRINSVACTQVENVGHKLNIKRVHVLSMQ